ncbi:MAG: Phosphate acetyltransferase [Chlamydiales bacterium]|nr:Phosphate acetyltransferase [Chlamydiales bacterium]MCH9620489.1 Phosphate acetyltransferase [Chlamydiales bacterium]MCH9623474.1 Phosphate acetyltransferase [Chlamydiales bacterium]
MSRKGLFIAATGQNVGKTTLCLGMISLLQKQFPRLGFIKPVGQQHVKVEGDLLVDKDVVLFKEHFNLTADYAAMSPVIFPQGFTRDFVDGKVDREDLVKKIRNGYEKISSKNEFILAEGTGHVGVGSIADINNAQVAKDLKLNVVLIAEGGVGSAFDQLALNRSLCEKLGVKVSGVILNRVLDEKREMIIDYMSRALSRWEIPLIGAIPYNRLLSTPTMEDFAVLFKTPLLAGEEFHYRHFKTIRLVATNAETFVKLTFPNQLLVTPATREDIIEELLKLHENDLSTRPAHGLILSGQIPPREAIIEKLKKAKIPTLYSSTPTYDVMRLINTFTAKILNEDVKKVNKAIELVESYLDLNLLMQATD